MPRGEIVTIVLRLPEYMSAVSSGVARTDDVTLLNRNPGEKSFVWLGDIREVSLCGCGFRSRLLQ